MLDRDCLCSPACFEHDGKRHGHSASCWVPPALLICNRIRTYPPLCRYISKRDKVLHANPPETDVLQEGDRIVALARTSALTPFEHFWGGCPMLAAELTSSCTVCTLRLAGRPAGRQAALAPGTCAWHLTLLQALGWSCGISTRSGSSKHVDRSQSPLLSNCWSGAILRTTIHPFSKLCCRLLRDCGVGAGCGRYAHQHVAESAATATTRQRRPHAAQCPAHRGRVSRSCVGVPTLDAAEVDAAEAWVQRPLHPHVYVDVGPGIQSQES